MIKAYCMARQGLVKRSLILIIGTILSLNAKTSLGKTFAIPKDGNVIGHVQTYISKWGDTLPTIGRRNGLGGEEMEDANPGVDYWQPPVGTQIIIPAKFILPNVAHTGIVVNMAEMRLYYFHPSGEKVTTFPVAIGKEGWQTPIGQTKITRKRKDPTWVVPQSIIEDRRKNNLPVFKEMPPGPKNPLGKYAMSLGFKNIVIHGTPWPLGVGLRTSHGCLRMMPEHIEALYQMVEVGTPVNIIYQPQKIGYDQRDIYLETHEKFVELNNEIEVPLNERFTAQARMLTKDLYIDWKLVNINSHKQHGLPAIVGKVVD